MQLRFLYILFLSFVLFIVPSSCKKYLDAKSDSRLSTPEKLQDFRAMLDNFNVMNFASALNNIMTDEYYITSDIWNAIGERDKLGYIWDGQTEDITDWETLYSAIFYANTVLDEYTKTPNKSPQADWDQIKGEALFFRAFHLFQLAQLYAPTYDPTTADDEPGLPLRLNSNFNEKTTRSTVSETYEQILADLTEAVSLLSSQISLKTRPSRPAAFALLARVHLIMGQYEQAKVSADTCLDLYNTLLDYNNIPDIYNPFEINNAEVLLYTNTSEAMNNWDFAAMTDSSLYQTYHSDDLRKTLFFETVLEPGTFAFEGSYNGGNSQLFNGLATDEVYLIRAECNARLGNLSNALSDLNTLLAKRYMTGTFAPIESNDELEVLKTILLERRKELLNRGVRWSDLRRLNKEAEHATTISRLIDGQTYTLPPNDVRYTLLIPIEVVQLTGIEQNRR